MIKVFHPTFEEDFKIVRGDVSGGSFVGYDNRGNEVFRLPINSLKAERGGAGGSLTVIKSTFEEGFSIYVRDERQLFEDLKKVNPKLKLKSKSFNNHWPSTFTVLGVLAAMVIGIYISWSPLMDYVTSKVPIEWEQKLGEFITLGMDRGGEISKGQITKDLTLVLQPLIKEAEKSGYKVKVYYSKDDAVNAFALPGGTIVFNKGLLKKAKNLEMIYGVAAHELAHVIKRHAIRGILGGVGLYSLVQLFFGDLTGVAAVLVSNGEMLIHQAHSRGSEEEADEVGIKLLKNINLSAKGLHDFFVQMNETKAKLEKEEWVKVAERWVSTHPTDENRIKRLKEHVDLEKSWLETDRNKQRLWKRILKLIDVES